MKYSLLDNVLLHYITKSCPLVFNPGKSVFDSSIDVSISFVLFRKNIDSSFYCVVHINPAIKRVIIALPLDVQFIAFCRDYFFNPEFCLSCPLCLVFIECSNNLFSVKITDNAYPLLSWSQRLLKINLECSLLQIYFCTLIFSYGHQLWI